MKTNQITLSSSHDHQEDPTVEGASFLRTCFNALNALSGIGILSIPYAFSEGGWLSLILLFVVVIMCWYTGLLLKRCMDYDPMTIETNTELLLKRCMESDPMTIKTYPDIGERAFGRKGRALVCTLTNLDLFLVAVEFLILEGDIFHKLFPHMCFKTGGLITIKGAKGFTFLAAIVILPTTWLTNLGVLAYVSAGGILASIVLVCCVFLIGVVDGVGFHEKGEVLNWKGLPITLSLFTFCYGGHAVFPALTSSMRDRNQFSKVLLVSFITSTITYGSMGILGYLMFGSHTMSQVTLNLPVGKIISKLAIYTTLVSPLTKYAIMINPIAITIEGMIPNFHNRPLYSILVRTGILISTLIVALTVPFFGYVMAFIGAFLSVVCSLLLPCICYLKINNTGRRSGSNFGFEFVLIVGIIIVSSVVGILGTYISLKQIIINL